MAELISKKQVWKEKDLCNRENTYIYIQIYLVVKVLKGLSTKVQNGKYSSYLVLEGKGFC